MHPPAPSGSDPPFSAPIEPSALRELLPSCMDADRARFFGRLSSLAPHAPADRQAGADPNNLSPDPRLAALATDISRSVTRRAARAGSIRPATIPADLPIAAAAQRISEAVASRSAVIICGETGSGKSTQIPKICLNLGRGAGAIIGHTQPRRIAARGVAARLAEELERDGFATSAVGVKVRFGDHTGPDTLVKLMTDGILLAEIRSDPLLRNYDTIIVDEAHERSLNIDFLLGHLKQVLGRRADLRVIVTSATIDPQRLSAHFDNCPIIEVSGRTFPVEVRHHPYSGADEDEQEDSMEHLVVSTISELIDESRTDPLGGGDILVFLPGEREIRDTAELIEEHAADFSRRAGAIDVLPLFARLAAADQSRVFRPPRNTLRIVLATNVAETSLTVPRIRYVIDSGLARISRYSPRTRIQRLPVEAISRASAAQRAGRCGRIGPGICVRLYTDEDLASRPEFTEPEILRTNLASVILQMKSLRIGDPRTFPFMQPPDERLIRDGFETLRELHAVDEAGELTPMGRDMARLPIDPRLARMVLAGREHQCLPEVLIIAAALSIQDPRERPLDLADSADASHARFKDEQSDFSSFLNLWRYLQGRKEALSNSRFRRLCRDEHLSFVRFREWEDVHRQLATLADDLRSGPVNAAGGRSHRQPRKPRPFYESLHRALLTGLLSGVGRKSEANEYTGCRGIKFNLFPGSGVFGGKPRWVVAADLVKTTRLYARCVAQVMPAWIEHAASHLVDRTHRDPQWDVRSSQVIALEHVGLYGLELASGRPVHYGPIDPIKSREIFIQQGLVEGGYQSPAKFARHNAELGERIRTLEAKTRRTDLLADAGARFDFFDVRIPASVNSGAAFEHWRSIAEKANPRILFMSESDLLAHSPADFAPSHFPDRATLAGESSHPIIYQLAPGEPDDGATLILPVSALNQIDTAAADYLVPGLLQDRFLSLIRSLPKHLRTSFQPAHEHAARCARLAFQRLLTAPSTPLPPILQFLAAALGDGAGNSAGIVVHPADFQPAQTPINLLLNFRITDDGGRTLAEGRDLSALRRSLGARLARIFDELPAGPFNRDAITAWDFGDLPEAITIRHQSGAALKGYPALVAQARPAGPGRGARAGGGGVGKPGAVAGPSAIALRIFPDLNEARRRHCAGLLRLMLRVADFDAAAALRRAQDMNRLALLYSTLGHADQVKDMILQFAAAGAFLRSEGGEDSRRGQQSPIEVAWRIRSSAAFDASIAQGLDSLDARAHDAAELALSILLAHQRIRRDIESVANLEPFQALVIDVQGQVAALVTPEFLTATPEPWVRQIPRYLHAVSMRITRLKESRPPTTGAALARDAAATAQVARWATQVEAAQAEVDRGSNEGSPAQGSSVSNPGALQGARVRLDAGELATLRWMIEEYRISLFAQSLRTLMKVSEPRLEEQWNRVKMHGTP